MLEEYLREAETSSEYASRWWACMINNLSFEQGKLPPMNVPMPPIDQPEEEGLIRLADKLTELIDDELNRTWNKQTEVLDEDGMSQFVPTPMFFMLWVEKNTPCDILELASNSSGVFMPWWAWPTGIKMRVSRFHVEIQRGNISPWENKWGSRPNSIPPGPRTNPLEFVREAFDR